MEFQGRIAKLLPIRQGVSQRTGNEWKSLPFIFEYFEHESDRYADSVMLETFDTNIMAQIGKYLKKGPDGKAVVENGECVLLCELKCRCGFSHSVRTFDRQDGTKATVNDVRLYKFEIVAAQQTQQSVQQQAAAPFPPQVDAQGNPITNQGGNYDDLPF